MSKYTIERYIEKGTEIFEDMPEGWSVLKGTTTQPSGYVWITNNLPTRSGKRKIALCREVR